MKSALRPFCGALVIALLGGGATHAFDAAELGDEKRGKNWLTHGRTHSEQRHSPLAEINAENVGGLSLAWSVELPDARQLVSTTLAVDGILYVT
ncbi:MAG: PQQ-dependent dehydrogenase, methanol/ethanol family, partial [Myxococcales bacterium]|nr:PQQ-dependent dehydrogenase, methanol/ethanol family [Myxococcales bacterium]